MKTCKNCKEKKPLSQFSYDGKYYLRKCKLCCQILYGRKKNNKSYHHNKIKRLTDKKIKYKANPEIYLEQQSKWRKKRTNNMLEKLISYLLQSCKDCSLINPLVMQFDHINDDKTNHISAMLWRSYKKWEEIEKEIMKCEMVCVNCHFKRTQKRRREKFIEKNLL